MNIVYLGCLLLILIITECVSRLIWREQYNLQNLVKRAVGTYIISMIAYLVAFMGVNFAIPI